MARDPLPVLLRVRRAAQDAARRELAVGMGAEAAATARLGDLDRGLAQEAAAIASLNDDALLRAAYPAWLKRAQRERHGARSALEAAAERTAMLRTQLADARAATRVAEALQERHEVARQAAVARREQRVLDEAGQRRMRNLVERVTGIEPA